MADEKPFEKLPEHHETPENAVEPKPMGEDLSDSELEEASGGLEDSSGLADSNGICGFGC